MDRNTIFVKTSEGEEAVRQRTRLVQRNLRNILIMVDGHATVADLAKRFGDEHAAVAALAELQQSGFVAVSEAAAHTAPAAAQTPAEADDERIEDVPVLTTQIAAVTAPHTEPVNPTQPGVVVEEVYLDEPEYESLPPPLAPSEVASGAGVAQAGWLGRIKALLTGNRRPAPQREGGGTAGHARPSPPRRRWVIGWPLLALWLLVGLAAILALTLAFYPYGRHLPEIERLASARMQAPVKVGGIGFSFLPRPRLVLSRITIGDGPLASIDTAEAVPDYLSWLGNKKAFDELSFNGVDVRDEALAGLARAAGGGSPVLIRRLIFRNLGLTAGDVRLDGMEGEAELNASGAAEIFSLRNANGTLKLELRPQADGFRLSALGSNWRVPFEPALTFEWLEAEGALRNGRLELEKIDGRVYGGVVEGKASVTWASGSSLAALLDIRRVAADKLLAALASGPSAQGDLNAVVKLSARAANLGGLGRSLQAEGGFEMPRGAVKGFDLGEAISKSDRSPTHGGETRFEQLSGSFKSEPGSFRLSNLKLDSGLMKAAGNLDVSEQGNLGGRLQVDLKGSAMTRRVQLLFGGTTKDPQLLPGAAR